MSKKVLILSGSPQRAAIPIYYVTNLCVVHWRAAMKRKKSELLANISLHAPAVTIVLHIMQSVHIKMIWLKFCKK